MSAVFVESSSHEQPSRGVLKIDDVRILEKSQGTCLVELTLPTFLLKVNNTTNVFPKVSKNFRMPSFKIYQLITVSAFRSSLCSST